MVHSPRSDIYLADPLYKQMQFAKELKEQLIAINQRARFFKSSVLRFFIFEIVTFWIIFPSIYYATQINFVLSFLFGLLAPLIIYGIGLLANKIKYECNYRSIQVATSNFMNECSRYLRLIRNHHQYITQESRDAINVRGMYHNISNVSLHEINIFLESILEHYEILWAVRREQIDSQIELQPFQKTHRGAPNSGRDESKDHCLRAQVSSTTHPSQLIMNEGDSGQLNNAMTPY